MKKFYISTPIYYSSGRPHIGHAYTTILADVISRYKKIVGYDIFFITGMDEHGQKIETTAKKENISCQELVDKNSMIFEKLWRDLKIEPTFFIRTTNEKHKKFLQEKFSFLFLKKYIYLGNWESLYCIQCEEDIVDKKIVIKDNKKYCEHGHEIISRSEESYFLKTTEFKKWIIDVIDNNEIYIHPFSRVAELKNNFLNDEFRDLSISRNNLNWGIEIKENPNHKIYVWLDALLNYISGLSICNDSFVDKYWNDDKTEIVHLLSKEITRFHCIYWPIILKMLGYRLPSKIISHGWIITSQGKMSKSIGNVIDPFELINKFGSDSVRYYLMKEISMINDSIFSEDLLVLTHNSDLCNNFGNIVNRTIGMLNKYNNGIIPKYSKSNNKELIVFEKMINDFINKIQEKIDALDVNLIVKEINIFENNINSFIEINKPWNLFKENKIEDLMYFLSLLSNSAKILIFFISPILVLKSNEAWQQFAFPENLFSINEINKFNNIDNIKVNNAKILFERIDKNEN
ncbi:MAG: methionine--tRNA ligase [Mycoplasmoidaceae bacterium]